jgi:hypothetical protein
MSNRMFITSTKNACVIKLFKDQVNLSEHLYRMTRDCGSPKHGDIYDCKFSFLEREKLLIFIWKIIETAASQNFQQLKQKYLPLLRQKNVQARRTSSFGIFTSPRQILLASGTGPPTNFEDWCTCCIIFLKLL